MGKQSHQGQIYCSVETKSHHQTSEREKYDAAGLRGTSAEMIGLHNICLYQSEGKVEEREKRKNEEREKDARRRGTMYGTATASSTTSTYSSISYTPSASLSSLFFFPLIHLSPFFPSFLLFSFSMLLHLHALTLVVQNVLAFHPFLFVFLFRLCLFSISLPLHSSLSSHVLFGYDPGGEKSPLDNILFMVFLSSSLIFTQRPHRDVNREAGAILIFAFAITSSSEK